MSSKVLKVEAPIEVESLPIEIVEGATYIIKQSNPNSYTHGFFKYPCKFIPEVPRWAIKKYAPKKNALVFDPFSGSGTTLLEAQIAGLNAYGAEIDPVAKKIIQTKTQHYTKVDIDAIDLEYKKIIIQFENVENIDIFVPKINNLEHWFTEENAKNLGRLKTLIGIVENQKAKTFLETVLLSIIKSVSQADDTSPKPYISSKIVKSAPKAFEKFKSTFEKYRKMLQDYYDFKPSSEVKIVNGNALNTKEQFQADIAVASPPYINAFDYARTLRLENLWLETHTEESILESKSYYVGTERFSLESERKKTLDIFEESEMLKEKFNMILEVDEKRAFVIKKFFEDMRENLINVNSHLVKDGYYVIVIGNSVIRKNLIESWKILRDIAPFVGFRYVEHFSYMIRNPYIRIPRNGRGGEIKRDHVLVLRKVV